MNIKVETEQLVTKTHTFSLKGFMGRAYEAAEFKWKNPDIVCIYIKTHVEGHMAYAFEVPYIDGVDLDNKSDVKKMIKKGYKEL